MPDNNELNSAFEQPKDVYNKKTEAVPKPQRKKDVDLNNTLYKNIIGAQQNSQLNLSSLESLSQSASNRNELYNMIDAMCEDGTISAILETYAEDATERNDHGNIVWAESNDPNIQKCVEYYLDSLNVNKNIYKWVYCLCKYGDVYLHLYRNSEYNDELFKETIKKPLNEDIKIKAFSPKDNYAHYMEMEVNPAEMFELTKFGKTVGYVKAPIQGAVIKKDQVTSLMNYAYKFKKDDLILYPATEFVHAALENTSSREEETISIFLNSNDYDSDSNAKVYSVKRGNSLLSDMFKIWRELQLLESSVLLNRVTKSSIVRLINIEVGDMPKENVTKVLMDVKRLIEQKAAINKNSGMSEYTNPGPVENNVYVPTHGGIGAITTTQIGGDVDVKGLADLEYYQNKLFGQARVPKQYFGLTDDSAGFNGGQSLSIISSRYAKMIKRIQNTIIQAITDAINLMLIDKGLVSYVNEFTIKMLPPTTQEEIDRQENSSNKIQLVSDVMNMLTDVQDTASRLKILKNLLANVVNDSDITNIIQEQIDKLELEQESEPEELDFENVEEEQESDKPDLNSVLSKSKTSNEKPEISAPETVLPNPEELGVDLTDTDNIEG